VNKKIVQIKNTSYRDGIKSTEGRTRMAFEMWCSSMVSVTH